MVSGEHIVENLKNKNMQDFYPQNNSSSNNFKYKNNSSSNVNKKRKIS